MKHKLDFHIQRFLPQNITKFYAVGNQDLRLFHWFFAKHRSYVEKEIRLGPKQWLLNIYYEDENEIKKIAHVDYQNFYLRRIFKHGKFTNLSVGKGAFYIFLHQNAHNIVFLIHKNCKDKRISIDCEDNVIKDKILELLEHVKQQTGISYEADKNAPTSLRFKFIKDINNNKYTYVFTFLEKRCDELI